jgi:enoyl-CoA hydratase
VLTGEGPEAFCAGADLKALAESELPAGVSDPEEAVRLWLDERSDGPLGFTRLAASKPTIAAVSGWCLAGGLELALWCDLRIATETAKLGFTERRFGVPLIDGGTQRLPRIVGMGRALEMILTGRVVEADVPADGHLDRALEIGEGLARFPQETMLSDRRAALEGAGLPLDEGIALEAELGAASVLVGVRGAARFAAGEGRGAEGAGV